MEDVYSLNFDDFQRDKEIKRYIYRVIADLTIRVEHKGR